MRALVLWGMRGTTGLAPRSGRAVLLLSLLCCTLVLAACPAFSEGRGHRVVVQLSSDDDRLVLQAFSNSENILKYYENANESIELEIVVFGRGLRIVRADSSSYKDSIERLLEEGARISACQNTKTAMEEYEGRTIALLPNVKLVPSGAVRLIELQEGGWSYLRP